MRYALYEERFYDLKMHSSCLFANQEHVLTSVQDSIFQWNMTKNCFQFVCLCLRSVEFVIYIWGQMEEFGLVRQRDFIEWRNCPVSLRFVSFRR